MSEIKKVVLAYSGGLDTSVILKWLQETYRCEVVTFTADLGQGEELEPARKKAQLMCSSGMPISWAFLRAGSGSSPWPRSAVQVTPSQR